MIEIAPLPDFTRESADDAAFEAGVENVLWKLSLHDDATRFHSGSVASWSRRIAKNIGLSAEAVTFIERAALLHDVGKLFTPRDILAKPGPLNDEEWARMREHAGDGADYLESIPVLAKYAAVVRAHHERLDGRGYPHQLTGDEIPFEAKIIGVADAFDAMISKRAYRTPLAPSAAITELQRCVGTQFDGDVVGGLLAVVSVPRIRLQHRKAI